MTLIETPCRSRAIPQSKIATCCYCGTRAALVLRGNLRHELACSSCGAPLHDLKQMPLPDYPDRPTQRTRAPYDRHPHPGYHAQHGKPAKKKKSKKKRKSRAFDLFEDIFDVVEDIFD